MNLRRPFDVLGRSIVTTLRRRESRPVLEALLLYLVGALLLTNQVWGAPTTHWIGSCCDPEQAIWFLRWVPFAIAHGTDPLVTQQLNAPEGVNLMWNTATLPWGLLAAPITLLAGPILAYNVLVVTAIVLSAASARLVVGRYAGGTVAPLIGGAVYGFSPYVVSHAVLHLDLTMAWFPPLALLVLDDLLVRRGSTPRRLGLILGLLAVGQLLTTEEVLATTAICGSILLVVLAIQRRSEIAGAARRVTGALAATAVTIAVVGAWPLAVQFLGPQRVLGRLIDASTFSTDLLNLVVPTRFQFFAPPPATQLSDGFSGLYHEADAYLGLPLLIVLAVIVARRRADLRVRTAAIVGAIMVVLSMGAHLQVGGGPTAMPLPWLAFSGLPILQDVIPSRFVVFAWLAVAILVGLACEAVGRSTPRQAWPRAVALGLALVLVVPAPIGVATAPVPDFFTRWQSEGMRADATILIAPFFRDGAGADPMLWAAATGDEMRMVEAYAYVPLPDGRASYGPAPSQLFSIMEAIQDRDVGVVARGAVRAQVAADLRARRVTDVIVGPMARERAMIAFFSDLFGRPPEAVDGVSIWRDVDAHGPTPEP